MWYLLLKELGETWPLVSLLLATLVLRETGGWPRVTRGLIAMLALVIVRYASRINDAFYCIAYTVVPLDPALENVATVVVATCWCLFLGSVLALPRDS